MSAQSHLIENEAQAVALVIRHLETLFPKICPTCDRRFDTLREFFLHTSPVGEPICYDADGGRLKDTEPLGAVALSNCRCGSTLALTSNGMPPGQFWALLSWARRESARRGMGLPEYLKYARLHTRKIVLHPPDGAAGRAQ